MSQFTRGRIHRSAPVSTPVSAPGTHCMESPAQGWDRTLTAPAAPQGLLSDTPTSEMLTGQHWKLCTEQLLHSPVRFSWCELLQTSVLAQSFLVSVSFLKLLQEQQRKEIKVVSPASLQSYNLRSAADRLLQIFNIWIHLPVRKTTPQAS